MSKKIVCGGYGGPHGYANGRLWFVCPKCRWNPGYSDARADALKAEERRQKEAYAALHTTAAKPL